MASISVKKGDRGKAINNFQTMQPKYLKNEHHHNTQVSYENSLSSKQFNQVHGLCLFSFMNENNHNPCSHIMSHTQLVAGFQSNLSPCK